MLSTIVTAPNARFKVFRVVALSVMAHTTWTTSCTHQDNDLQSRRGCEVAFGLSWSRVDRILSHRSSLVGNAAQGVRCRCTASRYGTAWCLRALWNFRMKCRALWAPILIACCKPGCPIYPALRRCTRSALVPRASTAR